MIIKYDYFICLIVIDKNLLKLFILYILNLINFIIILIFIKIIAIIIILLAYFKKKTILKVRIIR